MKDPRSASNVMQLNYKLNSYVTDAIRTSDVWRNSWYYPVPQKQRVASKV